MGISTGTALAGTVTGTVAVPTGYLTLDVCVYLVSLDGQTTYAEGHADGSGNFSLTTSSTGPMTLVADSMSVGCSRQPLVTSHSEDLNVGIGGLAYGTLSVTTESSGAVSGTVNTGGITNDGVCVGLMNGDVMEEVTTTSNGGRYVFADEAVETFYTLRAFTSGDACGDRELLPRTSPPFTLGARPSIMNFTSFDSTASAMDGFIDVPSGQSAGGLCVAIFPESGEGLALGETTTSPDGRWGIRGLAGATYMIRSRVCNPADAVRNLVYTSRTYTLPSAASRSNVDLTMLAGGVIDGVLVVAPGTSMPKCMFLMTQGGTDVSAAVDGAEIDALGRFRFLRLVAGNYDFVSIAGSYEDGNLMCRPSEIPNGTWFRSGLIVDYGQTVTTTLRAPGSDVTAAAPTTPSATATTTATTRTPTLRVGRAVVRGGVIITTFTASGPGTARQTGVLAAGKRGLRASTSICAATTRVKKAGTVTLRCTLNAAGKRLRKKGALKVVLTTVFSPSKGTKATSTRMITIPKR
jgi:hypothetical protein